MKKIISIMRLDLALTGRWVLLMILISLGAEGGLLYRAIVQATALQSGTVLFISPAGIIADAHLRIVFTVGLVLLIPLSTSFWFHGKSRFGYTMTRLGMSNFQLCMGYLLYGIATLIVYWGSHLALVVSMLRYYVKTMEDMGVLGINDQAILGAFWNSRILHAILPVGDPLCMFRNMILILALAAAGAAIMVREYYNRQLSFAGYFTIIWCINNFSSDGDRISTWLDIAIFGIVLLVFVIGFVKKPSGDLYPGKAKDKQAWEEWEYDYQDFLTGDSSDPEEGDVNGNV